MSKERQRARAQREAERAAGAAKRERERLRREERDRRQARRVAAAERRRRPKPRFGRRSPAARALIVLVWLLIQVLAWQYVPDTRARVGIALLSLVALPAFVVMATGRKGT